MFVRDYGISKISDITTKDIYDFVNRQDKGSLAHRNKRLTSIRGLLSYAIANAFILKDPSYGVVVDKSKLRHEQKEKRKQPAFTKRDYEKIRKHCSYFWSIAADFAWWTGLRMSDIAIMEWASFDGDHLIVHTLKTDTRFNRLPLDDELIGGGILRDTIARIEPEDERYCFLIGLGYAMTRSVGLHCLPTSQGNYRESIQLHLMRGNDSTHSEEHLLQGVKERARSLRTLQSWLVIPVLQLLRFTTSLSLAVSKIIRWRAGCLVPALSRSDGGPHQLVF